MKEQTPTIEIEGPRCKSHYDEAWREGTEDGAKRIKALRNAVHKRDCRLSNRQQCSKILVPMKLSEIMASGDIGVRSLPGCWRGHRLNKK